GTVYVIKDNRLEPREVTSLAIDDGFVLVDGALQAGEALLATRIPEAGEGLLVREVKTPAIRPETADRQAATDNVNQ
ncbi:MAG: efflux transporter periplasmic adaptor subunit, partial [Roseibium sp.]|nr:efflux transporter periplasmic adaptor subunit [Roseibium sp.]